MTRQETASSSASSSPQGSSADLLALVRPLLHMLAKQHEGHRALRDLIRRKRDAIRTADIAAITTLCEQEQSVAKRVSDIEKHRLDAVGRITERLAPDSPRPLSLREIADAVGEPLKPKLLDLADTLREEIEVVRRESSIVTAAAESLSRHMAGLVQTVQGALSRVGVYERRGRIAVGSQMDFSVDLKS